VLVDEAMAKISPEVIKSKGLRNAAYIWMKERMRKVLGMFAIDMRV
jgi:hypothetical protein